MFGELHPLQTEFPEFKDRILELRSSDAYFASLMDEYDEVDKEVLGIEENIETPSDEYTEQRKLRRLQLKDELYAILKGG